MIMCPCFRTSPQDLAIFQGLMFREPLNILRQCKDLEIMLLMEGWLPFPWHPSLLDIAASFGWGFLSFGLS